MATPKPVRRLPLTVHIYPSGVRRRLRYRVKHENGNNTANAGQAYSRRVDLMNPLMALTDTEEAPHHKYGTVLVRPNGDYIVLKESRR